MAGIGPAERLTAYIRTYIIWTMTSKGSNTRIKWEGDSNRQIRLWPASARENFGAELQRLDNYERPLKSKPMGKSLPGVHELFREDEALWYRLLYWLRDGWIYVLHCFNKKTNQTSKSDIKTAKDRMKIVEQREDEPFVEENDDKEVEKSA